MPGPEEKDIDLPKCQDETDSPALVLVSVWEELENYRGGNGEWFSEHSDYSNQTDFIYHLHKHTHMHIA